MGGRAAGFCATPPPAPVDNWSDLWINCGQAVLGHYPLGKVGAALRVKHLLSNGTTSNRPADTSSHTIASILRKIPSYQVSSSSNLQLKLVELSTNQQPAIPDQSSGS